MTIETAEKGKPGEVAMAAVKAAVKVAGEKTLEKTTAEPMITNGVKIGKDNRVSLAFEFGGRSKSAEYLITYKFGKNGAIGVIVTGSAIDHEAGFDKSANETRVYKNKGELRAKLNNDLKNIINTTILGDKGVMMWTEEMEAKIGRKIDMAGNQIMYVAENNKTDIKKDGRNMVIAIDGFNKATIEKDSGGFGGNIYRLILGNNKIKLDRDGELEFANSVRSNLPATAKKDKATTYPKLYKAFQMLEE